MSAEPEIVVALTTVTTEKQARILAEYLVAESLAACVQVDGPIQSHYVWPTESGQDQLEESTEFRLSIKATPSQTKDIEGRLAEIHPYELPQWIVIPAEASRDYLEWVKNSKKSK